MRRLFIGFIFVLGCLGAAQEPAKRSAVDLLNLNGSQVVRIGQLYDYVSGIRYQQEFPAGKAAQPSVEKMRRAFQSGHEEAIALLSPGQMFLLEKRGDELKSDPDVRYRLMLSGTYEEFMAMPLDVEAAKRWLRAREAYKRTHTSSLWLGYGLCGHHHWHGGGRPYCGNEFIDGGFSSRRLPSPTSPPRRAGSTVRKAKSG